MELRDLIVAPLLLIAVYAVAYVVRPRFSDEVTRRYFIPALTVRIIGALAVGFIYQFYYGGGDTFAYHTHGSRIIWDAFVENPMDGLRLLFSEGLHEPGTYRYSSQIWYFRDEQSFFVIQIAALFDLVTFSAYSGTAILFAVLSFSGAWMLFRTFYEIAPAQHKWAALAALFIPTVFFWGSGIFKDTITLAALGAATFCIYRIAIVRRFAASYLILLMFSFLAIYQTKIYILLCFLPAAILWIVATYFSGVGSLVVRTLLIPFVGLGVVLLGYVAMREVAAGSPKYNLEEIAETARVTAYDIRYWTGRDAGSGYSLGELDGSFSSMLRLAPAAVVVSLFRPWPWEIRSPFMLLSSLEGFLFLFLTIYVLAKVGWNGISNLKHPDIMFCLFFAVVFAFAVGVSTYNFGTLSRYKIPLLPYFMMGLGWLYSFSKSRRKVPVLADTE